MTSNLLKTVTEAGPSAFANIHENYYYVFVVCTAFFLTVAYFYFPYVPYTCPSLLSRYSLTLMFAISETKQKTLEEIAAAFGDRVVEVGDVDIATEEAITAAKNQSEHIE
jgi:hypothetical protein